MGGYDSHSPPLLGFSSSFPFHETAQSLYKAIKEYELVSTHLYDGMNKKNIHLHRYSCKYKNKPLTQAHTKSLLKKSPLSSRSDLNMTQPYGSSIS